MATNGFALPAASPPVFGGFGAAPSGTQAPAAANAPAAATTAPTATGFGFGNTKPTTAAAVTATVAPPAAGGGGGFGFGSAKAPTTTTAMPATTIQPAAATKGVKFAPLPSGNNTSNNNNTNSAGEGHGSALQHLSLYRSARLSSSSSSSSPLYGGSNNEFSNISGVGAGAFASSSTVASARKFNLQMMDASISLQKEEASQQRRQAHLQESQNTSAGAFPLSLSTSSIVPKTLANVPPRSSLVNTSTSYSGNQSIYSAPAPSLAPAFAPSSTTASASSSRLGATVFSSPIVGGGGDCGSVASMLPLGITPSHMPTTALGGISTMAAGNGSRPLGINTNSTSSGGTKNNNNSNNPSSGGAVGTKPMNSSSSGVLSRCAGGSGASRYLMTHDQSLRALQVFGAPAVDHDGVVSLLSSICGPVEVSHTLRASTTTPFSSSPQPLFSRASAAATSGGHDVKAAARSIRWQKEAVSLSQLTSDSSRPRGLNVIFETIEAANKALSLSGKLEHNGRRLGIVRLSEVSGGGRQGAGASSLCAPPLFLFDYDTESTFKPATLSALAMGGAQAAQTASSSLTLGSGTGSTAVVIGSGTDGVLPPLAALCPADEEEKKNIPHPLAVLINKGREFIGRIRGRRGDEDTDDEDKKRKNFRAETVLKPTALPVTTVCRTRFPYLMALPLAEYWLLPVLRVDPVVEDANPFRSLPKGLSLLGKKRDTLKTVQRRY